MGVREEIERWMKTDNIKTLCLHGGHTRERRKGCTWFFSGDGGQLEQTAGVAIIVYSTFLQYVEHIEPINDRVMSITLKRTMPTTIISAHLQASERPYEETTRTYDKIQRMLTLRETKDQYT